MNDNRTAPWWIVASVLAGLLIGLVAGSVEVRARTRQLDACMESQRTELHETQLCIEELDRTVGALDALRSVCWPPNRTWRIK
jgi:hypothetical protein